MQYEEDISRLCFIWDLINDFNCNVVAYLFLSVLMYF